MWFTADDGVIEVAMALSGKPAKNNTNQYFSKLWSAASFLPDFSYLILSTPSLSQAWH